MRNISAAELEISDHLQQPLRSIIYHVPEIPFVHLILVRGSIVPAVSTFRVLYFKIFQSSQMVHEVTNLVMSSYHSQNKSH